MSIISQEFHWIFCAIQLAIVSEHRVTVTPLPIFSKQTKAPSTPPPQPRQQMDFPPDILRHPSNGVGALRIQHQNAKMNRATQCRSGLGPEIVLTPQDAGAGHPELTTINMIHAPKPSIEIVATPQDAIRKTASTDSELATHRPQFERQDTYEEFDDDYYENFQGPEGEYAEISEVERKRSIKQPQAQRELAVPVEHPRKQSTLSEEIIKHLQRRKEEWEARDNDTDRSSVVEMTENDDLYDAGAPEYDIAAAVDNDNQYYALNPRSQRMSMPPNYESLRRDEQPDNNYNEYSNIPSRSRPSKRQSQRQSQYDTDADYYYDDEDWSTDEDYMDETAVRHSRLAGQDGRLPSATEC